MDDQTWDFSAITIGGLLDYCFALTTNLEAAQFMKAYEDHLAEHGHDPSVARDNIGYIIGYVEPPERRRALYELLNLGHPIFGGVA